MDWTLAITFVVIAAMFAVTGLLVLFGAYVIIMMILHRMDQKPAWRTRVKIAMNSCPDFLYGHKLMLTGTSRHSKVSVGTIVGFSRMRNEHLGDVIKSLITNKSLKATKKNIEKALEDGLKNLESYLQSKDDEGVRLPPKQFWMNLTEHDPELLQDLLYLNYAIIVPKIFGFFAWIPPLVKFAPKQIIVFLDSQIATPNKEIFGDIQLSGVNLNMVHGDYWFVDDERITKYTLAMCIRSDAYCYELVESWNKLSEIAKDITKTQSGVIHDLLKTKQPVGQTSYNPPPEVRR